MVEQARIREGFVTVPGGRVWYKIVGAGAGIPLILLHGGPGSTHWGMTPLEALADERPVVLYDQLGCGKSDRPDDLSLWRVERFVAELHQLRQQLGLSQCHILGHSWGTMLAMDYYLAHPQGIVSLIMSSPCISIPRWLEDCAAYIRQLPPAVQETLARHQQAGTLETEAYKQATEEFYRRHVFRLDPLPPALVRGRESRGHNVYATMWGPNEFYMEGGNLKDYDRSDRLSTITVPTLFSCGRVDEAAPGTTEWYHSLTPGSQFVVYEHSAHMPHWEEPQRYLSVVREFLRRVEP
jgi:proline iminopeptidase